MRIKRPNNISLLLILLIAASCTEVNPPSKTLDDYIKRSEIDSELVDLYFYPTTVRMLDKFISNGEGGILEGVKEGRLFYTNSDSLNILQRDFKELKSGLESEGFELLAEFKSGDTKSTAYIRDLSIDRYVILIGGADVTTMLVELKGEISIATLQGLSDLNSDKVMSLLNITDTDKEEIVNESKEKADSLNTKTIKAEN
jgi:hypothetical protein